MSGVSWIATCGNVSSSSRNSVGTYAGVGIARSLQRELSGSVAGARKERAAEDALTTEFGKSDMPPVNATHEFLT